MTQSSQDGSHLTPEARRRIMSAAYAYAEACQQSSLVLMRRSPNAQEMREARAVENASRVALENVLADLTWPPPYQSAPTPGGAA